MQLTMEARERLLRRHEMVEAPRRQAGVAHELGRIPLESRTRDERLRVTDRRADRRAGPVVRATRTRGTRRARPASSTAATRASSRAPSTAIANSGVRNGLASDGSSRRNASQVRVRRRPSSPGRRTRVCTGTLPFSGFPLGSCGQSGSTASGTNLRRDYRPPDSRSLSAASGRVRRRGGNPWLVS